RRPGVVLASVGENAGGPGFAPRRSIRLGRATNLGGTIMSDTASSTSTGRSTRRQFGRAMAGAAAGAIAAPAIVRGRNLNDKLNIAMIGVGGRGGANLQGVASENIVALCDVSEPAIDRAARRYSEAR